MSMGTLMWTTCGNWPSLGFRWRFDLVVIAIVLVAHLSPGSLAQAQGSLSGIAGTSEVRVEASAKGTFTPYKRVRYVLRHQNGSSTIGVTKEYFGDRLPRQQKVGLLDIKVLGVLLHSLDDCGLTELESASEVMKPAAVTWTFTVVVGDRIDKTITVPDPELQRDGRYLQCLDLLRGATTARLGPTPFRDLYFELGEFGFLHVASTPSSAQVIVNGREIGEVTPMTSLLLPVGEHRVELVSKEHGLRRIYSVKVMADITTNLDVDLR